MINFMRMKKYFNYLLMAGMVCGLSMGMVACSDDDDDNNDVVQPITMSVDQNVITRGITVDVHSSIVEIPVKCSGSWQAWLPSDVEWVDLEGESVFFEGNQVLRLHFDENRDKVDRSTTLRIITDDGEEVKIKVTQTQLWNGQTPDNGSNAQWFGDNGIGRGFNYEYMFEGDPDSNHRVKFDPQRMTMLNPIFNWANIVELQKKTGTDGKKILSADAYVENTPEAIDFSDIMRDSLVHGKDSIGVTFDLEISFGFVEFEGHGEYKAKENKDAVKLNYLISRSATVYEVFTSPSELAMAANDLGGESELTDEELEAQEAKILKKEANYKKQNQMKYKRKKEATPEQLDPDYLEPWQEEAINAEYDKLGTPTYAGIFSKSFGRLYFKLNRAVESGNDEALANLLEKLDSDYGPLFVGRGWFGGSLNMRVLVDKDSIDTDGQFSGTLAGGVNNIFHIEGTVTYMEEATRYVRNSDAYISVYGGNASETANKLMAHFSSDAPTDRQHLLEILEKWGDSLKETIDDNGKNVPSKAVMESMQLIGIWTLFDNEDTANAVRDYMFQKHPDLKKYVGDILGSEQKQ